MKRIKCGKEKTVYRGKIFKVKECPVELPSGRKTVFEFCERVPSATILAFNDKKEILMIKEYRRGFGKNVWFLPGGRADKKNETPKQAVRRELREETGYDAKTIKFLYKKTPGNTLIWDIYVFAGKNLKWNPLPPDDGEEIKPIFIPFKKAVRMALDGKIENEFISYHLIRFDYMLRHGQFKW